MWSFDRHPERIISHLKIDAVSTPTDRRLTSYGVLLEASEQAAARNTPSRNILHIMTTKSA